MGKVVNAELLPQDVLQLWTEYLSPIFPTFPLLLSESSFPITLTPSLSRRILKSTIQETSKTACLLGIPSAGKTTLLNTLLDRKIRTKPTTSIRSHSLGDTEIIDTPAYLPLPHPLHDLILNSKASVDTVNALVHTLHGMGDEHYAQLERVYGMPALVRPMEGNRYIDPTRDLLIHVARKFARVGKKGPNLEGGAEVVGSDCVEGKIHWWTLPAKE